MNPSDIWRYQVPVYFGQRSKSVGPWNREIRKDGLQGRMLSKIVLPFLKTFMPAPYPIIVVGLETLLVAIDYYKHVQQLEDVRRTVPILSAYFHVEPTRLSQNFLRDELLSSLGISDSEARVIDQFGPLDELRASYIRTGPFTIALTDEPSRHLTFDEIKGRPELMLLNLSTIFTLYNPQRIGLVT